MPIEAKPIFRPEVLHGRLAGFTLPTAIEALRPKLAQWGEMFASCRANQFKETELLPDFLAFFFYQLLGYRGPSADSRLSLRESRATFAERKATMGPHSNPADGAG